MAWLCARDEGYTIASMSRKTPDARNVLLLPVNCIVGPDVSTASRKFNRFPIVVYSFK